MVIILLSGESGKRLWPLSNGVRSKQFIKCLKKEDGGYESMIQRTRRQINQVLPQAHITVVTSRSQASAVINQLGDEVDICAEPFHKDSFSAVSLAVNYLSDIRGMDGEECVAVCPADTFASQEYFALLQKMECSLHDKSADLCLTAITPTYPSGKYGYLFCDLTEKENNMKTLTGYIDRPQEKEAEKLIKEGALWNGGIFAAKLDFWKQMIAQKRGVCDFEELYAGYGTWAELSFENEIIQSAKQCAVFLYEGDWRTLGTWNTLTEAMEDPNVGNALFDDSCKNVHVVNELDVPVLCMGLCDVVISASPEGILVSDKTHSSYIGPYVEQIDQRIMFADKSWGSYRVLDAEDEAMTIKVTLNPGHSMNYHSHERRDEVWTIISGRGRTIVDGMEQPVRAGDVITMEAGCRHTIIADTELHMIEVQLGREISVHDKKKYELEI